MANFLITSPNSLTQGTESNDLFVLNTALGTTVYGNGGNDQISAAAGATNAVNAILNGGQGNDSIFLTAAAPQLNVAKVIGGDGNDLVAIDANNANNATIQAGGGADTIQLSGGVFTNTTVNAMGGVDLVTASGVSFVSSLLALGGGNDTLNLQGSANTTTIAAGGGSDFISATIQSATQIRIEGDTVGDTEFFGNDTINIGGTQLGVSALVQGGGGADILQVSAALATGSTLNGNAGSDSITIVNIGPASAQTFVGGGAGADTIAISAALAAASASIFGGGGADVINVSGAIASTGAVNYVFGGEDADTIGLGSVFSGTQTNVRYSSFSDSNLSAYDVVSANAGANGTFIISETVVSATRGINLANGAFATNGNAVVTWTSAAGGGVTARASQIDANLTTGQSVIFADGAGNNYLFIQAGSQGGGTDGDLLVRLTNNFTAGPGATGGIAAVAAGTALTIQIA